VKKESKYSKEIQEVEAIERGIWGEKNTSKAKRKSLFRKSRNGCAHDEVQGALSHGKEGYTRKCGRGGRKGESTCVPSRSTKGFGISYKRKTH